MDITQNAARPQSMRKAAVPKRIGMMLGAGLAGALPFGVALAAETAAPLWYDLLYAIGGMMGAGIPGMFLGLVALVANRDREDGGTRAATIIAAVSSLAVSAALLAVL